MKWGTYCARLVYRSQQHVWWRRAARNISNIPTRQSWSVSNYLIRHDAQTPDAVIMPKRPPHLVNASHELSLVQQVLGLTREPRPVDLQNVVFVCIDIEAFESEQDKVTEIGVAILDTYEVSGVPPGEDAVNWLSKVKHAHYRPVQYADLVNRRFVKGCEDSFNFGTTTWIDLQDTGRILNRIFTNPARLLEAASFDVHIPDSECNVIFVGHGLKNEKIYLGKLGLSIAETDSIVRMVDVQNAAGATKKAQVSLQRLLLSLGIAPTNLHNGGNDAAYTLQALVLMAVKDRHDPGSVFSALAANSGKLPSVIYNNVKAPHVYGGTATRHATTAATKLPPNPSPVERTKGPTRTDGTSVRAASLTSGTARTQHKRAVRAARGRADDRNCIEWDNEAAKRGRDHAV